MNHLTDRGYDDDNSEGIILTDRVRPEKMLPRNEFKSSSYLICKHIIDTATTTTFDGVSNYVNLYLMIEKESESDKAYIRKLYQDKLRQLYVL